MSLMPVFPLSGAFHEVDDEATAFGGSRATRWVFNVAAQVVVSGEPRLTRAILPATAEGTVSGLHP